MKKKKGIEILKIAALLTAVAIVSSFLTRIVYLSHEGLSIYDIKEINASFAIGDKAGLAADSDVLNFGMVSRGGSSTKEIVLYHEYEEPLKVKIIYTGSIAEVLSPIKPFYLEPNNEKRAGISAYAIGEEGANYTGTVKVFFIKT